RACVRTYSDPHDLRERPARSHGEKLAPKPHLMPGASALGADMVCIAKHQATGPWFPMAPGALHPRIEKQRQDVEADQDRNNDKSSKHGLPPSVCGERSLMLPQGRRCYRQAFRHEPPSISTGAMARTQSKNILYPLSPSSPS